MGLQMMRMTQKQIVVARLEELSMSMSACLHPLKKCAINIHRESNGFLVRKINFEKLKQMSKDHSIREISTWNQEVFEKHKIDDKFSY